MIHFCFKLILIFFLFFLFNIQLLNALKCYQCSSQNDKPCGNQYLKNCSSDQAYDMCSISYKKTDGILEVIRQCVLGPCSFQDKNIPLEDQCDMSKSDFNCILCCKGDGCNKNSVNFISPNNYLLIFLILALVYSQLYIKFFS